MPKDIECYHWLCGVCKVAQKTVMEKVPKLWWSLVIFHEN